MRAYHIHARAGSRFHFGALAMDNKTGLATTTGHMPSDSLFSALISCVAKHDGELATRLVSVFEDGRLLISSVFFFLENGERRIYFLPKPVDASVRVESSKGAPKAKDVKKVRFLSKGILDKYGEEWTAYFDEFIRIGNSALALAGEIGETELSDLSGLYGMDIATHVNTRPHSGEEATELYQTGYMAMPEHGGKWRTGMYFLCDASGLEAEEIKLFDFAVRLLRFEGLGGKRSSGYGFVDSVEGPYSFGLTDGEGRLSLSLFVPKSSEELSRLMAYDLCARGGRHIGAMSRLKRVNMILEGAVSKGVAPVGRCVDISPDGDKSFLRLGTCLHYPLALSTDD